MEMLIWKDFSTSRENIHVAWCTYGDDDEDEEVSDPYVRRDAIQGDRERRLSRCCCDDAEARNQDGVEVDRLEILSTDSLNV